MTDQINERPNQGEEDFTTMNIYQKINWISKQDGIRKCPKAGVMNNQDRASYRYYKTEDIIGRMFSGERLLRTYHKALNELDGVAKLTNGTTLILINLDNGQHDKYAECNS